MSSIDSFLSLELISGLGLSFRNAKRLQGLVEMLPKGPGWQCKPCDSPYPTKKDVALFYRDPPKCIQSILSNPLVNNYIRFTSFCVYESAWLTGDVAWSMQSQLLDGATLLGIVLSSDKMNISAMTGRHMAHLLLMSLANLLMDFCMKGTNHAFLLLALLPVPKFIHKDSKTCGVLENCMVHECLDFILTPLKKATQFGIMMLDPLGSLRYVFTPLASYIVDVAEAIVLTSVGRKTSHVTMASHKQFGDPFQHEPRTALTSLAQLHTLEAKPFWRDWPRSEPSKFLTPSPLAQNVLGPQCEMNGASALSKVPKLTTNSPSSTHIQASNGFCYLVAVIVDAVPNDFLIAVRLLMDFRYLAQAPEISEQDCGFHDHKSSIISAGAQTGKSKKEKSSTIGIFQNSNLCKVSPLASAKAE
ncbi:hypothetical protein EDB85DRAFT_1893708 [Lactarius pseudohatsudake]|nr:hypothetical protein EDB85DRAFT_1893708 [Lactarius pseudohatsudake]